MTSQGIDRARESIEPGNRSSQGIDHEKSKKNASKICLRHIGWRLALETVKLDASHLVQDLPYDKKVMGVAVFQLRKASDKLSNNKSVGHITRIDPTHNQDRPYT